jgi:prepilin-type N-terminal cleavage/methylation domain-containing protein
MKKRRGFTLLEVLIAVTILVGGVIVVGTSWSGNFLRMRKATLYNNVALLLERKVTELEAEFREKPLTEVVDQTGNFGTDLPQYRWSFTQKEFVMPDLSSILLGNDNTKDEMLVQFIKATTEYISKSVKEGTVTVFVKAGAKEIPFTVTTYFIDYSQELSVPGLPSPAPAAPPGDGK